MDNVTALDAYQEQLNKQARAREYFLGFIGDEPLHYIDHVKIQASVIAQLTGATNQLTRNASVRNLTSTKYSPSIRFSFLVTCCIEMSQIG